MSDPIPTGAKRVLDEGVLCYVAAVAATGPHVTPVVYVLNGGRIWVTTARRSVKAAAWRRDSRTAGIVRSGSRAVAFSGNVRTFDALDPFSWPDAVFSAPRLTTATAEFTLKNARFFAGYAVDARRVPFSWSPPGRVFVEISLEAGRLLDVESGEVVDRWGHQPEPGGQSPAPEPPAAQGLDLAVPERVRDAVGEEGEGALALSDGAGLTVVPVSWRRTKKGAYKARLPAESGGLSQGLQAVVGGLAIDRASAWRASEMKGMLLQGLVELTAASSGGARRLEVKLRPSRVVWWDGWSSGTVRAR